VLRRIFTKNNIRTRRSMVFCCFMLLVVLTACGSSDQPLCFPNCAGETFRKADLRSLDLSNIDLHKADFSLVGHACSVTVVGGLSG